ncbi:MAG: hypothetical protein IMZ58_01190 [Thermoplasmata archaeon]|nr:hypothetical protein [Thermoplasmata archaeon]
MSENEGYFEWNSPDGIIISKIHRLTSTEIVLEDVWVLEPLNWSPIRLGRFKTYLREDLLLICSID